MTDHEDDIQQQSVDWIPERPGHRLVVSLFLRGLGLTFFVAFTSLWAQAMGLFGSNGIMPAQELLSSLPTATIEQGGAGFLELPSLFLFIDPTDVALHALLLCGTLLSVALILGFLPRPVIFGLWSLYLSFFTIGQPFLGYQWDILLLEVGFLAVFIAPGTLIPSISKEREPPLAAVWIGRLVLFKLVLSSGLVKLKSGDPTWQDLTALDYHFWTQPIPHQLSYLAHQLGSDLRQIGVLVNHYVELCVPWLILFPISRFSLLPWIGLSSAALWFNAGQLSVGFCVLVGLVTAMLYFSEWMMVKRFQWRRDSGRASRGFAFVMICGLMAGIGITGNYGFFNLLTCVLCLLCLDDRILFRFAPSRILQFLPKEVGQPPRRVWTYLVLAIALVLVPLQIGQIASAFVTSSGRVDQTQRAQDKNLAQAFHRFNAALSEPFRPFKLANSYGLFARMTTDRYELDVQGSLDGKTWKSYLFEYKPNKTTELNFAWLHMPRLDWQMWFAALYPQCSKTWFFKFLEKLTQGAQPVLSLLEENPFKDKPPRYIRVSREKYRFPHTTEDIPTAHYWKTEPVKRYCPTLTAPQLRKLLHRKR
ncbi:MAG: lipase maturation factor family protein [Bradymonadia bacterium]